MYKKEESHNSQTRISEFKESAKRCQHERQWWTKDIEMRGTHTVWGDPIRRDDDYLLHSEMWFYGFAAMKGDALEKYLETKTSF